MFNEDNNCLFSLLLGGAMFWLGRSHAKQDAMQEFYEKQRKTEIESLKSEIEKLKQQKNIS